MILNRKPINYSHALSNAGRAGLCNMQQSFKRGRYLLKRLLHGDKRRLTLNLEGLTVCALVYCWVCLVCAYMNLIQRTIVLFSAVVLTLCYAAANCMVRLTCHNHSPPYETSITSG